MQKAEAEHHPPRLFFKQPHRFRGSSVVLFLFKGVQKMVAYLISVIFRTMV